MDVIKWPHAPHTTYTFRVIPNIKVGERAKCIHIAHEYMTAITFMAWYKHFNNKKGGGVKLALCNYCIIKYILDSILI